MSKAEKRLVAAAVVLVVLTAAFFAVPAPRAALVSAPMEPVQTAAPTQRLNINLATQQQLDELPGIGPVIAGRIVSYREENGAFASEEELLEVEGIGSARLEAIRDYIICQTEAP